MQIHISNRDRVDSLIQELKGTIAVISITDPDTPTAYVDCDNILRLQFHDLDRIWSQLSEVTYFNWEMAESIIEFVAVNSNVNHMIVHCEAGVARSPAVAAAISEHLNITHVIFRTHCPNTMVFSILRTRCRLNQEREIASRNIKNKVFIPTDNWAIYLANAIRNAESGKITTIVVRSHKERELGIQAHARMCPEKNVRFVIQ